MAGQKYSQADPADPLDGTEILGLTQNGADVQTTTQDIADLAVGSYTDEKARDAIGTALIEGNSIDIVISDPGDTITVAVKPVVQSVASAATVTPTFANDLVRVTAQAAGLTLANPTGTAEEGKGIVIRIKDNGTARAISYGTQYRAVGVTLPTTTVISKTLYLGMLFNETDTKWDVVTVRQEA